MLAPNEMVGDLFYSLHKQNTMKAHTARTIAEQELDLYHGR